MRVVFDTNVLISALALQPPGNARGVFDHVLDNGTIILSEYILREFFGVCTHKLRLDEPLVREAVSRLRSYPDKVTIIQDEITDPVPGEKDLSDKSDIQILRLAVLHSDTLITRDRAILSMQNLVTSIKILKPEDFWRSLPK